MGDLAGRPWVMLSAGAGKSAFKNVLRVAFKAGCSGFLAGRAIWLDAFSNYPDWEKINTELRGSSASYLSEISNLANQFAVPWNKHPCYSREEGLFPYKTWEFRRKYEE